MEKIEAQLKRLNPELSMHESQVLWSRVEGRLSPRGVKSPKKSKRPLFRAVTAGLVILGLLGGSVVTAYASESLPGDTLYSTKLTIERAQIILAPTEKKKELQLAFADRRVKEVGAVLADIEEEEPTEADMAMVMTLPAGDPASGEAVATLAVATIEMPEAPPEGEAVTFAMNATAPQESEGREQEERKEQDVPLAASRAKSMAPVPMLMMVHDDASSSVEVQVAPIQPEKFNAQKGKRWKNLERKKKALTVAIRELERSREELRENGATSTSERVDEVIVNLTELNTTGTTPDDMFVEKMKNSEVEVLPKKPEQEKVEEDTEEHDVSVLPEIDPLSLEGAIALSLEQEVASDTEKEIEEVKLRNEVRKHKLERSRDQANMGRWGGSLRLKRVPVCMDKGDFPREVLVFEKDISRYITRGFVLGACPSSVPTATSSRVTEVSATGTATLPVE